MPRTSSRVRTVHWKLKLRNGQFHILDESETYSSPYACLYCDHPFKSFSDRNRHIMLRPECRKRHMHALETGRAARREREYKIPGPSSRPYPLYNREENVPIDTNGTPLRYNDPRQWTDNGRTCQRPKVERFPAGTAGSPISDDRACPRDLGAYLESCGNLAKPDYMEAAELLLTTGVSSMGRDQYLKSSFFKGKTRDWTNDRKMLIDVDKLPHGPAWEAQVLTVGEGRYEREHVLYKRAVVDVIRELITNPAFKHVMRYAPERHWTNGAQQSRVYGEMWTGNWWWRQQAFLRDEKGTIAPVIIVTDKTQMTKLSGNQSAYPVYLTIGNISKAYHRQATKHATALIGYLPVDSFKDVPSKALRQRLKGELLHCAMSLIMEPLEEAGQTGVEMWCADGRLRWVYPQLAAFVGDWPEQNDMACTSCSGCPKCLKRGAGRGDERCAAPRTRMSSLLALDRYLETGRKKTLDTLGLKPWWPWWADLPGVEFATCITPNLLHQIHKGLFKGHAMRWIQHLLGEPAVDERFVSMTRAKDLRHFKRGISVVSQWTGREAKEMEKVFLPLLAEHPALPNDLVAFIRALLDFSYIARAARLTDTKLDELREAHAEMHHLKRVLVTSGIYKRLARFDRIPKWHMISHYADSIRELGTPDGYNMEAPEYLHIVYVKRGFEASNKRDAIPQIIKYCQRLEALRIHRAHLDEYYGQERRGEPRTTAVFVDDEDGAYSDIEGRKNDEEEWEDVGDGNDDDGDDGDGEEGPRR
ncbi:hypothetical protein FS749_005361 [Ceratobasidium sp. UAMH 11750]|nr:hypothetical protein FS749_005361 [Ceratobasidium sp. UAMH 11750]